MDVPVLESWCVCQDEIPRGMAQQRNVQELNLTVDGFVGDKIKHKSQAHS